MVQKQVAVGRRLRSTRDFGQRYALVGALVVVVVIFTLLEPGVFLSTDNIGSMLGSQVVLVFSTFALVVPLVAGDYDMSVASVLTLASMLLGVLNAQDHMNVWVVVLITLCIGAGIGALNGYLAVWLGIDSFIVTLGVGTVLQGVVLWMSNDQTFSGVSSTLVNLVVGDKVAGIPLGFFYGVIACAVLWYVLDYTSWGRRILFVGRGRNVAKLSGIPVERTRFVSFVVAGSLAALAGILYAGTTGGADPSSGLSYLLPSFAAAFLGSTSIRPGRFNPWGSFIGVYFLIAGISGLAILGVQTFAQDLFYGGALVAAVAAAQLFRRRQSR